MPDAVHEQFVKRLGSMRTIDGVEKLLGEKVEDYLDRELNGFLESFAMVLQRQ